MAVILPIQTYNWFSSVCNLFDRSRMCPEDIHYVNRGHHLTRYLQSFVSFSYWLIIYRFTAAFFFQLASCHIKSK